MASLAVGRGSPSNLQARTVKGGGRSKERREPPIDRQSHRLTLSDMMACYRLGGGGIEDDGGCKDR